MKGKDELKGTEMPLTIKKILKDANGASGVSRVTAWGPGARLRAPAGVEGAAPLEAPGFEHFQWALVGLEDYIFSWFFKLTEVTNFYIN